MKFACDEVCAEIFAKFVHLCLVRCEKKNNLEIPLFLKTTRNLALLFSGVKKKTHYKGEKEKKIICIHFLSYTLILKKHFFSEEKKSMCRDFSPEQNMQEKKKIKLPSNSKKNQKSKKKFYLKNAAA